MGFLDKVGSFLKREAKDLGDAAEGAKEKLDEELTRREDELKMTPSEKIAALQQQAAAADEKLDAIADKATGRAAMADAVAEVGDLPTGIEYPNITHIILPDGRVRSGNDIPRQIVDEKGAVHEVPVVEAPTIDDLQKPADPPSTVDPGDGSASPVSGTDEAITANAVGAVLDPTDAEPAVPSSESVPDATDELPARPMAHDAPAIPADDLPPPPGPPDAALEPPAELPAPPDAVDELPAPPPPAEPIADATAEAPTDDAPSGAAPPDVSAEDLPAPPAAAAPAFEDQDLPAPPPAALPDVSAEDLPTAPLEDLPAPPPPAESSSVDEPSPPAEPVVAEPPGIIPVAEDPADPTENPSSPDYGKTPAQIKYERARAAANDLLDELRGELKDDGSL